MSTRLRLLVLIAAGLLPSLVAADERAAGPSLFEDGDLVVLLGGTLVERAQEYGHWEAALQLAHPDKTLRFRNLGWSGDTVWAESRGQFDPPEEGYKRMIQQVTALKPDVIILGYGNAEAFAGTDGLEAFEKQYRKLVAHLPDVKRLHLYPVCPSNHTSTYHADVRRYEKVVRHVAAELGDHRTLVNLTFDTPSDHYADNGIHLNDKGYLESSLFIAGQNVLTPSDAMRLVQEHDASSLLAAIRRKNRLVFDRWRPQNVTYLFGFRKHEQGQNAAEIPQFDPLIEAADAEIDRIKRQLAGEASNHKDAKSQR